MNVYERVAATYPDVYEAFAEIGFVEPQRAFVSWLWSAPRLLKGERPLDLLERGEKQRVLDALKAIAEGVFV